MTGTVGPKSLLVVHPYPYNLFFKFYLLLIITGVTYKYWTFERTSKLYPFLIIATTIISILFRFFSRIFSPFLNKFIFIFKNSFSYLYKLYLRQYKFFNFILYVFLAIITYVFIVDLTTIKFVKIILFTIISFAVSMYISDNYTFSQNIYIKILQKLVFLILKVSLIAFILEILDISIFSKIHCDPTDVEIDNTAASTTNNAASTTNNAASSTKDVARVSTSTEAGEEEYYTIKVKKGIVDQVLDKGKEVIVSIFSEVAPELGVGAAAGKAAAETIKQTTTMRPLPRLGMIAGNTFAAAASTKMAIQLLPAREKNSQILSANKDSIIDDIPEIESPPDYNEGFINSALEDSEIPLVLILNGLNFFNYLEFSCILSLFLFLFSSGAPLRTLASLDRLSLRLKAKRMTEPGGKYLIKKIKFVYLKLTNKGVESTKVENITLNKSFNTLDKYSEYIILYVLICFFWIKLLHMNTSFDLASNIDSYVAAYLILKKKSLLCLFTYNKYNFISPISRLSQRIKFIFIQRLRLYLYYLQKLKIF